MPQATDSQIAMWRGAIALAWSDYPIDNTEKERLLEYFQSNILLSDIQRAQLASDLDRKTDFNEAWKSITDPEDRAYLIEIAPSLFATHGDPTPNEQALYEKMCAEQLATIDTNKLEGEYAKIKEQIPVDEATEEAAYKNEFHHMPLLDKVIYHFEKFANDFLGIDPGEG